MKKFPTKKIVYMAFLMALNIILERMLSLRIPFFGVEGIRIGFGALPVILAGITFGPLAGGIVGGLGDLLGFSIMPLGGYMPHFTLTAFLTGFIPGLLFFYVFKKKYSFWSLLIPIAVGQVITSIILVPIFLNVLFGSPVLPVLIPRLIAEPMHMVLYAYLIRQLARHEIFVSQPEAKITS